MQTRTQSQIQLISIIGIAIFANVIAYHLYTQFDLTEDKQYTLTQSTDNILTSLEDPIYIEVLLDGEFPAGFKRLQKATQELIEDLRSRSSNVEFAFTNPSQGPPEDINAHHKKLIDAGLSPVNLRVKNTEGTEQKLIFPYAILTYRGRTTTINLLEPEVPGVSPHLILNNSISLLEYKFASNIQRLQDPTKKVIAYLQGHGELSDLQTRDLTNQLRSDFDVGYLELDQTFRIPQQIDLLIVAKPTKRFSEKDKFKIDQYIMNGGKVIWLIDRLAVNLDSMRNRAFFIPSDYDLNIEDQLYRYGARIEPNLLADRQCTKIPQVVGRQGGQNQYDLFDWYYHPLAIAATDAHPITKNLGGVNFYFPSSIDTIRTKTHVVKTPLLTSSLFSKTQYSPVRVSFEILKYAPEPAWFNKPNRTLALLLEGTFSSLYTNRLTKEMNAGLHQANLEFKAESINNKMIVISDGDIIKNLLTAEESYLPLGYNQFTDQTYANKPFMINIIDYIFDENNVIAARNKNVKLRLLNTPKIQETMYFWQFLNLVVPAAFIAIFGFLFNFFHKRRYTN